MDPQFDLKFLYGQQISVMNNTKLPATCNNNNNKTVTS